MTAAALLIAIVLSAPADEPARETGCRVVVGDGKGTAQLVDAPDLHVLAGTALDGDFAPALPAGATAILCARTSIVPAEHDDEVPALGLPLFLETEGGGRLATLEMINGGFRYRLLESEFRREEEPAVQARLDLFKARHRDRERPSPH
jgi:hypothetical protein